MPDLRFIVPDLIVPDAVGCDSPADMVATVCAGPNDPVVDF